MKVKNHQFIITKCHNILYWRRDPIKEKWKEDVKHSVYKSNTFKLQRLDSMSDNTPAYQPQIQFFDSVFVVFFWVVSRFNTWLHFSLCCALSSKNSCCSFGMHVLNRMLAFSDWLRCTCVHLKYACCLYVCVFLPVCLILLSQSVYWFSCSELLGWYPM